MKFLLYTIFLLLIQISSNLNPNCPSSCGPTRILYPFGLTPNCSLPGFQLRCQNQTPFLSSLKILNISNSQILIDSTPFIASDCKSGSRNLSHITIPDNTPFTISSSNHFLAIGCDTVAIVNDQTGRSTSGCVSVCTNTSGFCQASVPKGRKYLTLGVGNMFGYRNVSGSGLNCSYGFLVQKGWHDTKSAKIAMSLDWEIEESGVKCLNCGENSYCKESSTGYLCYCLEGFSGNPYVNGSDACRDIDECLNPGTNPCVPEAECYNRVPGFKCKCPFGSSGDGTVVGSGCRKIFRIIEAVIGVLIISSITVAIILWVYFAYKRRALINQKAQNFQRHGGLLLKQKGEECVRFFSSSDVKQATDNYSPNRILGTGAYGTVYKAHLQNGPTAAIKKSKMIDQDQINLFINELRILSQIEHPNIVRLLGCCLETEVPMLVYEYVPNGTLYEHIHGENSTKMSWKTRVRIAVEAAEALSYMHALRIFHRDVKSTNILLDKNLTAKVSDFGISRRLVEMDQTEVVTLVQGTFGYLDPEYMQTSQLTSKSDVYSFGVVLVELLTGEKPLSSERRGEDSNLAMYFLSSMKCREMEEFIEEDVVKEASKEELVCAMELARKCLLLRGEKRPSMMEVVRELLLVSGVGRNDGDGGDQGLLDPQVSLPPRLEVHIDLARSFKILKPSKLG